MGSRGTLTALSHPDHCWVQGVCPPPGASGVLLCSYGNGDTYGMGTLSPLSPSSHDTAVHPSCRPGARIALLRVRVVTHHRLTSPLFIVGFVKIN